MSSKITYLVDLEAEASDYYEEGENYYIHDWDGATEDEWETSVFRHWLCAFLSFIAIGAIEAFGVRMIKLNELSVILGCLFLIWRIVYNTHRSEYYYIDDWDGAKIGFWAGLWTCPIILTILHLISVITLSPIE